MINKVDLKKEIEIKDFNSFKYDDFISNSIEIFINSNLSKKGRYKLRQTIQKESFYPVNILHSNENDSEQIKSNKLNELNKANKILFLKRYYEIIKNQYKIDDEENILEILIEKIKNCPYCRNSKFELKHNYSSIDCQSIKINFKCTSCNENLFSKTIYQMKMFDAKYVYNEKIKSNLDKYVKYYPNSKVLLEDIVEEFKNTKIEIFLF